jgi:transcriptional regulator NrdR family protein
MIDPVQCPKCGSISSAVTETEAGSTFNGRAMPHLDRHRRCTACGERIVTRELVVDRDSEILDLSPMPEEHRQTMRRLARALAQKKPRSRGHVSDTVAGDHGSSDINEIPAMGAGSAGGSCKGDALSPAFSGEPA